MDSGFTLEQIQSAVNNSGFGNIEEFQAVLTTLKLYLSKFRLQDEIAHLNNERQLLLVDNDAALLEKQTALSQVEQMLAQSLNPQPTPAQQGI